LAFAVFDFCPRIGPVFVIENKRQDSESGGQTLFLPVASVLAMIHGQVGHLRPLFGFLFALNKIPSFWFNLKIKI